MTGQVKSVKLLSQTNFQVHEVQKQFRDLAYLFLPSEKILSGFTFTACTATQNTCSIIYIFVKYIKSTKDSKEIWARLNYFLLESGNSRVHISGSPELKSESDERLYTRYPIFARRAWPAECVARAKVSCIQDERAIW